jgi:hypothetical protein
VADLLSSCSSCILVPHTRNKQPGVLGRSVDRYTADTVDKLTLLLIKQSRPYIFFKRSTKITSSTMLFQEIQQEVSYLNELGMDFHHQGKLRSAAFHFNMAMEKMKMMPHVATKKRQLSSGIMSSAHFPSSICQPLPLHDIAFTGAHWELVTSLTLIHNAAMVNLKCGVVASANQLLQLATRLIKKLISPKSLHQLLSQNKFALTVVTSIYIGLGKSAPNKKEADRPFAAASGLMSRYSKVVVVPKDIEITTSAPVKANNVALSNAFMLLSLRRPCVMTKERDSLPFIMTTSARAS